MGCTLDFRHSQHHWFSLLTSGTLMLIGSLPDFGARATRWFTRRIWHAPVIWFPLGVHGTLSLRGCTQLLWCSRCLWFTHEPWHSPCTWFTPRIWHPHKLRFTHGFWCSRRSRFHSRILAPSVESVSLTFPGTLKHSGFRSPPLALSSDLAALTFLGPLSRLGFPTLVSWHAPTYWFPLIYIGTHVVFGSRSIFGTLRGYGWHSRTLALFPALVHFPLSGALPIIGSLFNHGTRAGCGSLVLHGTLVLPGSLIDHGTRN